MGVFRKCQFQNPKHPNWRRDLPMGCGRMHRIFGCLVCSWYRADCEELCQGFRDWRSRCGGWHQMCQGFAVRQEELLAMYLFRSKETRMAHYWMLIIHLIIWSVLLLSLLAFMHTWIFMLCCTCMLICYKCNHGN